MSSSHLNVLVLCTGNSCRSILGEALINHLSLGRLRAYSAGSQPVGQVNPHALATLERHGLPTEGYSSRSWDEWADIPFDLLITVCDSAAGEACPLYLAPVARGHWGLPDPAKVSGSAEVITAAFDDTYTALERRIKALLEEPLETLSPAERSACLNRIGASV
ncbi:MAG: arsenate reductase ArsC [Methylococcaceae bacterium]